MYLREILNLNTHETETSVIFILFVGRLFFMGPGLALVDSLEQQKSLYEQLKKGRCAFFTSHLNFQFCTSLTTSFQDFALDQARFKLNRLRMEVLGRFFDKFLIIPLYL